MEITLEQIETVKDRTGASYKEAKEALEATGGSVVDAIIYIEDNIDKSFENDASKIESFKNFIKDTAKKGNATRIKVYKDEELLVNLPITAGIVGIVIFRWWGIIAAAFATGVSHCRVELAKEDGTVIDITDKAAEAFEVVKDKGGVLADEAIIGAGELYEAAKEKGADLYETARDTASRWLNKNIEAEAEEVSDEDAQDATVIVLEEGNEDE